MQCLGPGFQRARRAGCAEVRGRVAALAAMAFLFFADLHAGVAVAQDERIDFATQIQPILKARCVKCHGPEKQKGELRLDGQEFVVAGGHTGNPILSTTPEHSELYLRIISDDPNYSMPVEGPPLDAAQIKLLRRWLEQGAKWAARDDGFGASGAGYRWWIWADPFLTFVEKTYGYIRKIAIPILVFLIFIFLVERAKHRRRSSRADMIGADGLANVQRLWYLVGALALAVVGVWAYFRGQLDIAQQSNKRLEIRLAGLSNKDVRPVERGPFGGPVPPRPKHPKQLGGTYFRGNDERDERLFNGGFYRTATFHLKLTDAGGKELRWGDPAPEGGLFVSLEIVRARSATPALFTDAIMQTIFLSRQVAMLNKPDAADAPAYFENVEPGERWVARYPIGNGENKKALKGMIYVYKGHAENGAVEGKFHYGISYDVTIVDGVVSSASELWMGSLSVPTGLLIPPPDRMVLNEWFDSRPLPEIEGQNSTDPALLGIPEYVK